MLLYTVTTFDQWRNAARPLLSERVRPDEIEWGDAHAMPRPQLSLVPQPLPMPPASLVPPASPVPPQASAPQGMALRISAAVLQLLETLALYRDAGRWELMYRLAWRTLNGQPRLLEDAADPDVRNAALMQRAVNRDVHKMHAYVRFRETTDAGGGTAYFAWFEPQHEILRRAAVFFVRRFANMHWTIATPDGAAVWKLRDLCVVDPPAAADRPRADPCEDLWRTYYRSICNVARLNPAAMQREMPRRYWRHLPEALEIDRLVRDGAVDFTRRQRESPDERLPLPLAVKRALPDLPAPADNPQSCRRCPLWRQATQAVVGAGAMPARLMLVGEQPGDEEDLRGTPFVGPAGKLLDRAIAASGLDRDRLFITNAVKHFKWQARGKRRLHQKPGTAEIQACNVWLAQEIGAVQPIAIVALGASALRALTGIALTVDSARRQTLRHAGGAQIFATYHPSAILRADGEQVDLLTAHLEADLRAAASAASAPDAPRNAST